MKIAELFASLSIRPDRASFTRASQFINGAKRQLQRFVVVGAIAGGVAAKLISDVAKSADEFSKMSRKVGISVEGLQQLEFAAEISGASLASLRTGLQRMARTADDAAQGLESAREPFERLGVEFEDTNGKLRDTDSILLDVADRFAEMPDGTEKTALAMKTFGRAGADLIPLLNEGRSGIGKLRTEFEALGAQISTKDAQAFEEYNDTLLRVKTVLIGLRNQAVIALLPMLQELGTSVLEWVKANRELLKQKIERAMRSLLKAIVFVVSAIGFLINNAKSLIALFVVWKAVTLALTLATTAMGTAGLIAWIKMAAPILLVLALIAIAILVIQDLWVAFTGGKSVFADAKDWLLDVFFQAILWWEKQFDKFFDWLSAKFRWVADKANLVLSGLGLVERDFGELTKGEFAGAALAGGSLAAGLVDDEPVLSGAAVRALQAGNVEATITINESQGGQDTARQVEEGLARAIQGATPQ